MKLLKNSVLIGNRSTINIYRSGHEFIFDLCYNCNCIDRFVCVCIISNDISVHLQWNIPLCHCMRLCKKSKCSKWFYFSKVKNAAVRKCMYMYICKSTRYVTVWTVVHTVLTAISQSNGNGQTLTTHRIQTPWPITIKLCTIDYVHETNT